MMDLPQIITANAVGLMLMLILLMHMRGRTRSALVSDRLFVAMVYLTAVLCVLETASFLVDGRQFPGARLLNYVSNALLFALDIVFAYLWVLYADFRLFGSHARLRRRGALLAVPAAAVILMDLCGVFFTVSPQNVYSRRPLVFLSYLLTYFYLAFGSAIICRNRRKVSQYIFMPVSLLMGPIAVGSVIQFFCYGMATLWVCVAVGTTSLYIITQTQSMYVDSLSGLYNRLYLDSFLSGECDRGKPGARLAGIMLDIDSFKTINDTFGHLTGDQAICSAARILRESLAGQRAFAARYGGDEFVILLRLESGDEAQRVSEAVRERTRAFNEAGGAPYHLAFSFGLTELDPSADCKDDFLRRMDQRMYEMKNETIKT